MKLYRLKICILFFLFLLSSSRVTAQFPTFKQYTQVDGLVSNDIYCIVFDKNNNLWATSDRGVLRFDGYSFRNFSMSDGLVDNCNLRIFLSPDNEIWLTSILNSINYIKDDKVFQVPFNPDLMSIVPNEVFVQNLIFQDSTLYITLNNKGIYSSVNMGPLKPINGFDNAPDNAAICLVEKGDADILAFLSNPRIDATREIGIHRDGDKLYMDIGTNYIDNELRKEFIRVSENEFFLSFINKVIHIRNDSVINSRNFVSDVLDIYLDHDRKLWVSVQSDGVYGFANGNILNATDKLLSGKQVTCIVQDHENHYWFSTIGEGIFMIPFIHLPVYKIDSDIPGDHQIVSLKATKEKLFFGTYSGKLMMLEGKNNSNIINEVDIPKGTGPVRRIAETMNNTLLLFRDSLLEIEQDGSMGKLGNFQPYAYDYLTFGSGRWWISLTRGIVEYQNYQEIKSYEESENKAFSKVRYMFLDSHDSVWLSSQTFGIFKHKDSRTIELANNSDIFKSRSPGFIETNSAIWFSPSGQGLCRIAENGMIDTISTRNSTLSSDIIDVLFKENDTTIWLGTSAGLNRLCIKDSARLKFELKRYTMDEGLPSNRINAVEKFNDEIWVGTNSGLIRLDKDFQELEYMELKPLPTMVLVNDSIMPIKSYYKLKPLQNNIEIHYKAVSFNNPLGIEYMYKLEGLDRSWIKTKDRVVRYPKIDNGTYTFLLTASHKGIPGDDKPEELSITFEIEKHFFERIGFIVLWVVLFAILLVFIFLAIFRQIKKRENEKYRILLVEKEALLSQMNPHFIFNSLNSIQYYIVQNDTENATRYLSRFASLIRRIIDNSRKNEISLEVEIETLKLYLKLEKLRFEDGFDYRLECSRDVNPNVVKIPPMLIQPMVENAILHGLTPLKDPGLLTINFSRHEDRIICKIEDNGIGRERSVQNRKPDYHKPTGLINIKERIELLNKINNENIYFSIVDLKDDMGSAKGTQVILSIPL